ncbi:histidinol dehydrogenase [Salinisphaera sp. Q1T1-3]|uniref:histidinol dehydrogenase n=1 Tax=Salinisphaera sp. Q1T1-3 TaxID=2321229 RepID=UPI000E71FF9E|nr:histidinol dehydrogenase [Salinisphaera sp. Q1T1-3]RJS91974.1 histidinol dehydrogenase [Salinisphaera sp. Q1T1-3]
MREISEALAARVRYLKSAAAADPQADHALSETVAAIITGVRERGDAALAVYTERFDGLSCEAFEVDARTRQTCVEGLDAVTRRDTEFAIAQVRRFAEAQRATLQPLEIETLPGVHLGHRILPLRTVGCYVPGGRYPLLSAPIMSLVPAVVAGCEEIVACLPPTAPESMVGICHLAGATRIFRIGGAQAIAAMAYGTETMPAVDKIMGPGNAFVNEAKRQVFGAVGIDALAGPSEIFTIADDTADPRVLAADMLAQAEHDPMARPGLATLSTTLAEATIAEVERQLESLSSAEVAGAAWQNRGEVVVCDDIDALVAFTDAMATEHLQIQMQDPDTMLARISHYGSAFLGPESSVVFSDKCCGTNHTLPTGQAARYTGGLWVGAYLKTVTHQRITADGVAQVAPSAIRQSRTERMEGHARAAAIRQYPEAVDTILSGGLADIVDDERGEA